MIRVLHLIPRYRGDYPLLNLQLCLDPARFRSSVWYAGGAPDGANGAEERAARVVYQRLPEAAVRWYNPRLVRAVAAEIDREEVDVVCCQPGSAAPFGVLAAGLARRRPTVVAVVHGTANTSGRRALLMRLLGRRLDRVVAVSEAVAGDIAFRWRLSLEQVTVVRNGLDYAPFSWAGVDDAAASVTWREAARAALVPGAPPGFWYGTVGRLHAVKDQQLLIRAFAALGAGDERLLIAGRGPEETRLRSLAARLGVDGRVAFLGHRDDVAAVLPAVDAFVLPSRREGLPLALLEALAAARPVVATRVAGTQEVLDAPGADDVALLIPPHDVRALAGALRQVRAMDDGERRARGARGRRLALARFPAARMIRGYEDVLEAAAARRTAASSRDVGERCRRCAS